MFTAALYAVQARGKSTLSNVKAGSSMCTWLAAWLWLEVRQANKGLSGRTGLGLQWEAWRDLLQKSFEEMGMEAATGTNSEAATSSTGRPSARDNAMPGAIITELIEVFDSEEEADMLNRMDSFAWRCLYN